MCKVPNPYWARILNRGRAWQWTREGRDDDDVLLSTEGAIRSESGQRHSSSRPETFVFIGR